MGRKYTGFDGNSKGKRAGTEQFIREFIKFTDGAFWNNGSWNIRSVRGGTKPSIHGTGRAVDLSFRGAPYKGCGDRKVAMKWVDFLVKNADALGIEMIIDYSYKPLGRTWKCDRYKWKRYIRPTIAYGGKSWADWIHVELSPQVADSKSVFIQAFKEFAKDPNATPPQTVFVKYRGKPIRRGEKNRELVKQIQRVVGAKVDGWFGPQTEKAVMRFQAKHGLVVDGWIGKQTWAVLGRML